jgi:hypothetical protein
MKRHCWILLALCLFFTKKNYLSGAYAFRCSATFAYAQTVIDKRIFEPQKNNFRNCKSEFLNRAVENLDQLCRDF